LEKGQTNMVMAAQFLNLSITKTIKAGLDKSQLIKIWYINKYHPESLIWLVDIFGTLPLT
jgi:hypothetical protein